MFGTSLGSGGIANVAPKNWEFRKKYIGDGAIDQSLEGSIKDEKIGGSSST